MIYPIFRYRPSSVRMNEPRKSLKKKKNPNGGDAISFSVPLASPTDGKAGAESCASSRNGSRPQYGPARAGRFVSARPKKPFETWQEKVLRRMRRRRNKDEGVDAMRRPS
mmetsp:Transcript_6915/g.20757  ORF Transcript_6915/g.20757 Transcript_6915/m.20757 type:complete len:110 (-) Transcript_6915:86-415(-)